MNEPASIRGLGPAGLFRRDVGRALDSCRFDRRLPVVVVLLALAAAVPGVFAREEGRGWLTVVGMAVMLVTLGFLGAERLWFVFADRGERVPPKEILQASKVLWKRFLGLGIYALCLFVPVMLIGIALAAAVAGDAETRRTVGTSTVVVAAFAFDIVFTFATPATAFGGLNAGEAVRRSLSIIRSEWPSSSWYAIAPPVALQALVLALPADAIGTVPRIAVLLAAALIRLVCVGAVALFYADRFLDIEAATEPDPA